MKQRFLFAIAVCLVLMLAIASPWAFGVSAAQLPASPETPATPATPAAFPLFFPLTRNDPTATPLPTPTATPPIPPTSTPQLDGVYVASQRGYWSKTSYYLFAEVVNGWNEQVCGIDAVARFYDSSGALVATENDSAMLSALSPQQRAPIRIIVLSAPASLAYSTLDLSWSTRCTLKYRSVTVMNHDTRDTNLGMEVFGEVRNDNQETMNSVKAVVTFYDAGGRIWYAGSNYIAGASKLTPGYAGVFNISAPKDDLLSLPYTVQAQGYAFATAQ